MGCMRIVNRIFRFLQIPLLFLLVGYWLNQANAMYGYSGYIDQLLPDTAGNTGPITLNVLGEFPANIAKISLWDPTSNEILGTILSIQRGSYEDQWGQKKDILTVQFDLTGVVTGYYNLSIVDADNPGGIVMGANTLHVQEGTMPRLWVELTGQTFVRIGSSTSYFLTYGNSGNTDLPSGILFIGIPKGLNYSLGFDLADYQLPSVDPAIDPSGDDGKFDATVGASDYEIIRLYVQNITPVASTPLKFTIQWGQTATDHVVKTWWAGSKPIGYNPVWPQDGGGVS